MLTRCMLRGQSPDANATTATAGLCYLGRPWNDLATTVFLRTYMGSDIRPAGFTPFSSARPTIMNTTFYAEYDSYGASLQAVSVWLGLTDDMLACRTWGKYHRARAAGSVFDRRAGEKLYDPESVPWATEVDRLHVLVLAGRPIAGRKMNAHFLYCIGGDIFLIC